MIRDLYNSIQHKLGNVERLVFPPFDGCERANLQSRMFRRGSTHSAHSSLIHSFTSIKRKKTQQKIARINEPSHSHNLVGSNAFCVLHAGPRFIRSQPEQTLSGGKSVCVQIHAGLYLGSLIKVTTAVNKIM
jgi:hypothetical protein